MKVVGFVGSPRKDGNTDVLVQQVLQSASATGAETRIFYLNELSIQGCQGCDHCKVHDGCKLQDDMTPLYKEIIDSDGIVLGSPVYLSQVSGQTKIFLDRCYALLNADYSSKLPQVKKTLLVFCQANPDGERYSQTLAGLAAFLSSGGLEVQDTLIASGLREAGSATGDGALMQKAREMGEKLAKDLKMAQFFKKPDAVSGPSKAKRNKT